MAFKFILGHHVKSILNDAEEKQKKDIKEFAGGHLNESLLLKTELVLDRKKWDSAQAPDIKLTKASKPTHKPIKKKNKEQPHEALYDFSLGTSGVIPPAKTKVPKSPDVRYKLVAPGDPEPLSSLTDASLYSQLEDGVLIEEMPPQELMMHAPKLVKGVVTETGDPSARDNLNTSNSSILSRHIMSPLPLNYNLVPMHSKGLTRKDQYRRMKAFDATVLQKREITEQKVLSGERAARHHEFKLEQDLDDLNLNGIGPNFHRLQVFSNVLEDVIDESPTFNYVLRCIKTEYDNYIASLLDGQQSQQHLLRDQVDHMADRGTSRPEDMEAAMDKLARLETEARGLLDMNARLREDVTTETDILNKAPENQNTMRLHSFKKSARKASPTGGFSKKEEKVELSLELEHMKALILEKMDELTAMRVKLREEFVPMTVCTHLEQCIKETEVEVQKLLKQNEYFERSIAEMDQDLKEAIVEADTSEKDARRIWHKVNSKRGLPGQRQGTELDSDGEDDETKWNWYIS